MPLVACAAPVRSPAIGWRLCAPPSQTVAPRIPCCRVYCHHLAVVDDWEFWERQQPFSLGQQRAIAAALNTLVFRTQLPDNSSGGCSGGSSSGAGRPAGSKSGSLGRDYRMLQQAAPLLHRCAACCLYVHPSPCFACFELYSQAVRARYNRRG